MRALVVSEHAAERHKVAMTLGPSWQVTEATNGLDALLQAHETDFDLVVTDQTTEPYGGLGLSRELKTQRDPPAVILLLERPQDAWLARWSGADRWIVRPYDPFALADAAAEVTRVRRKAQPARRAT